MNIRLTLNRPLIIEAVKNETFLRGQMDKAADDKAITLAYHEQAGDDTYHERIIERGLTTALAELLTQLSDYIAPVGFAAADNVTSTYEGDNIIITLSVSSRFNQGYTDPLAKLAADYITNAILMDWWRPVNEKQSQTYAAFLERNTIAIRRCFNKRPPEMPVYNYPTAIRMLYPLIPERDGINGTLFSDVPEDRAIDPLTLYANPWLITRGDRTEISYTLEGENGADPFDDIIVRCDNPCCRASISPEGQWSIEARKIGVTIVTLFSRHDDQVYAKFAIRVTR